MSSLHKYRKEDARVSAIKHDDVKPLLSRFGFLHVATFEKIPRPSLDPWENNLCSTGQEALEYGKFANGAKQLPPTFGVILRKAFL